MGAFTSTEQKYHHLQANFHHCANALAELEFQIEFSHIEDGTPKPSSFPTPYTYWGMGRDNNTSTTPPPSSTPLPQGQIGEPPELLNISEELVQQLLCPITQEVMRDLGLIMKATPTSMPPSWHILHAPKLPPSHAPLCFPPNNISDPIVLYVISSNSTLNHLLLHPYHFVPQKPPKKTPKKPPWTTLL